TPFFAVFMLQTLGMALWQVTALQVVGSVLSLGASRFWHRCSQHYGVKPVVLVASLGEAALLTGWLYVGSETEWLLPLIFLSGVFGSPLATGANNMVLVVAPARNASPYLAVFSAWIGPVAALAPVMGGIIAESAGSPVPALSGSVGTLKF